MAGLRATAARAALVGRAIPRLTVATGDLVARGACYRVPVVQVVAAAPAVFRLV
jgi:hypothetical protein